MQQAVVFCLVVDKHGQNKFLLSRDLVGILGYTLLRFEQWCSYCNPITGIGKYTQLPMEMLVDNCSVRKYSSF
jgi:hypothetical protein